MPEVWGKETGPDHLGFPGENIKEELNHAVLTVRSRGKQPLLLTVFLRFLSQGTPESSGSIISRDGNFLHRGRVQETPWKTALSPPLLNHLDARLETLD